METLTKTIEVAAAYYSSRTKHAMPGLLSKLLPNNAILSILSVLYLTLHVNFLDT